MLGCLNNSSQPIAEVIVVDSGDDRLLPTDHACFANLNISCLRSESSVCIQRNKGIRAAASPWIFICDDDMEVPAGYLSKLSAHVEDHPQTGAVSGIVLERGHGEWQAGYKVTSAKELFIKYIFGLSIWGNIQVSKNNRFINKIKTYYINKGNHISKAGWPVVTDFSGEYFTTPLYGLGASLIRKSWLEISPYDEILDQHGIGDNYGVAMGFPTIGVHVLNNAFVYHHKGTANRLQKPLQYYRRVMALDHFIKTKQNLRQVKKRWLLWSLFGNTLISLLKGDRLMISPSFKSFLHVFLGRSPYSQTAISNRAQE